MDEIDDNVRASLSEAIDAEFLRHDERPDGEPIPNFDVAAFTLNFETETIAGLVSDDEDTEDQEEKTTRTVKEFCRICLCNDRKLSTISPLNRVAFQCVLRLDESKNTEPRLSKKVCWECNARMTSFRVFRTKAIQTNTLLYSLIRPFMNETLDVSSIDKAALNLTTSLQTKIYPADHTNYPFVCCNDQQGITPKNHDNRNNEQITLPNLDLTDDDAPTFNYVDSSNKKQKKTKKLPKNLKRRKKRNNVLKEVDRRCKPANAVLNNDIFNIKDLNHEEQMYDEINKRQFSST